MVIICYFSDGDFEIMKEWVRLEVADELGRKLCERVWRVEEIEEIKEINVTNESYKYIMCNEM